jgi:hypothetical protein
MMLSIERWLLEEKSFGITGGGILLSVFLIGIFLFIRSAYQKRHRNELILDGKRYVISGMAQVDDKGKTMFFPLYKETQ